MCGIAGIVSQQPLDVSSVGQLDAMLAALVHRGPDGEGRYSHANLAVGMRRLSIIDPAGGWQPLYNEDKSLALVANGEIYNFIELRDELRQAGHVFKTGSDCETILHLYERHGVECLRHLRGMFAFALWDSRRQRLFLARDRVGEKPLYLHESPGRLVFASELRALLKSGRIKPEPDPAAVDLFFHYQYVPEPGTILKGVRKLPAGCWLTVDIPSWTIRQERYWRMENAAPLDGDPVALLREQFEQIGKLIIRSDVPIGVALSGGLDSSWIAALAARHSPAKIQAFTVGYADSPESDERTDARQFAQYLDIPCHEVVLTQNDLVESFPKLVTAADDPIADIAGFGYFSVMRAAREHGVAVMMQGQGGDELFWGYDWVRRAVELSSLKARLKRDGAGVWLDYWRRELPAAWDFHSTRRWLKKLAGFSPAFKNILAHRCESAERFVFYDLVPEYQSARQLSDRVCTPAFREQFRTFNPAAPFTSAKGWDEIEVSITRLIIETYLQENGIAQGDRLGMASSVELRLPFLDYRLVETVIGLRKHHPDSSAPPKDLFRKTVGDLLPPWVLARKKRGFSPPVAEWRRALEQKYGGALREGFLVREGILDPRSVEALYADPQPRAPAAHFRFQLLVLEHWFAGVLGHLSTP